MVMSGIRENEKKKRNENRQIISVETVGAVVGCRKSLCERERLVGGITKLIVANAMRRMQHQAQKRKQATTAAALRRQQLEAVEAVTAEKQQRNGVDVVRGGWARRMWKTLFQSVDKI
eukprot:GHVS01028534.1.p1 GENE.GHVS01028534.1~~GHVS01028534.1.p1  ORF type:complete len:118 (+),score=22.32 GHVS01028534.1:3-356(+)